MYHEKSAGFEAEERLSISEQIVNIDPMVALRRGRRLQGLYIKQVFGSLFSAIGKPLAPVASALKRAMYNYRSNLELARLDDRMLSDIGISRAEAVAIATGKQVQDSESKPRGVAAQQGIRSESKLNVPGHFSQSQAA
tara:strand:+ start:1142 stop:1555 length:414 start_codon:yes stop_codon:yes gene_type:complete